MEDITTYVILYTVRVCEKEVRTTFYVRLLRILLHEINGIIILFFLPENCLIGTETCWIIKAYYMYFDGRFYEGNLKSV